VAGRIAFRGDGRGHPDAVGCLDERRAVDRLAEAGRASVARGPAGCTACGYFNAKAVKLQALAQHLARYGDDLDGFFARDTERLRIELLGIHGVGEETADSVVLYAAGKPSFVVDAYTRRILGRLGLGPKGKRYADYRVWFQRHLAPDAGLYNEYHALFVRLGKDLCRKREPRCRACPLRAVCAVGRVKGQRSKPRTVPDAPNRRWT
jgi:endonuclease-3 related protein